MERLQKILAARGTGVAPRGGALDRSRDGLSVNGTVIRKLGSQADPAKDSIKVDGKRVKPAAAPLYFAFHKPPGMITTLNDPQKRPGPDAITSQVWAIGAGVSGGPAGF